MLQEAVTIAACLDGLLMGKAAWAADVLAQRLKALESLSRGTHWTIARQLELIRSDPQSITGQGEGLDAAKAAREEEKLSLSLKDLSLADSASQLKCNIVGNERGDALNKRHGF